MFEFNSLPSLRLNQRRQEHLVSLGLDLADKSVLEVGAGIGAHTHFFLDRNCRVVVTEARPANLRILRSRYPGLDIRRLNLDSPESDLPGPFDVVYCFGVLYHLRDPASALKFMAHHCQGTLLLETCVSFGDQELVNLCPEPKRHPSQSVTGTGCRPTRSWVRNRLAELFPFVYLPKTQPYHEQFPLDWTTPPDYPLTRAVFIASRQPLDNPLLGQEIPMSQTRR